MLRLQIVDTRLGAEARITPGVQSGHLSVNRTAVMQRGKETPNAISFLPSLPNHNRIALGGTL
jgi:hypothetical protein